MENRDGSSTLDGAFSLLISPAEGLRQALRGPRLSIVIVVTLLAQLSTSIATFLGSGSGAGVLGLFSDVILALVLSLCWTLIGAAFLSFYLVIGGGRGDPTRLVWALFLGDAPWMLATPLTLVSLAMGTALPALSSLGIFLTFTGLALASFATKAIALSILYHIDAGRAAFLYLVAYGTVLVLGMLTGTTTMLWMLQRSITLG